MLHFITRPSSCSYFSTSCPERKSTHHYFLCASYSFMGCSQKSKSVVHRKDEWYPCIIIMLSLSLDISSTRSRRKEEQKEEVNKETKQKQTTTKSETKCQPIQKHSESYRAKITKGTTRSSTCISCENCIWLCLHCQMYHHGWTYWWATCWSKNVIYWSCYYYRFQQQ